jgi:hypothetical protein
MTMPSDPAAASIPPAQPPEPPPLPPALLAQWPVIAVGAGLWLLVTVLAFTLPALESWRPVAVAGLAVSVVGTSIFLWQRSAVQRGARGAQKGLTIRQNRSKM